MKNRDDNMNNNKKKKFKKNNLPNGSQNNNSVNLKKKNGDNKINTTYKSKNQEIKTKKQVNNEKNDDKINKTDKNKSFQTTKYNKKFNNHDKNQTNNISKNNNKFNSTFSSGIKTNVSLRDKENEKRKTIIIPKGKNKMNNNKKKFDIDLNTLTFNNDDISNILNSKIGFPNLGNSCFMNTCLQNLIHSDYFIKILFSKLNLVSKNTPITYHFIKLCLELIKNNDTKTKIISPRDFKETFSNKHSEFKGPRQQDVQEFCRIFLEDINQELNEIKEKPSYTELSTINKTKIECDKEFYDNFKNRENSLIIECFYSQIINIFICKCGFETYSFQKVLDFPLLLKEDCKKMELKNLLNLYFENKDLTFEKECEKCQKKEMHTKTIKFSRTPNILILSLQRRNEKTGKKNNCILNFPEKLDISEYIDEDCGCKNESKYLLYGIGNHCGDFNSGHFYSYIKLNNDKWYEFNDSKIYPYTKIIESSSSAYILFYSKLNKEDSY